MILVEARLDTSKSFYNHLSTPSVAEEEIPCDGKASFRALVLVIDLTGTLKSIICPRCYYLTYYGYARTCVSISKHTKGYSTWLYISFTVKEEVTPRREYNFGCPSIPKPFLTSVRIEYLETPDIREDFLDL